MLRGAGGPAEAHKRLLAYLDWANVAVQTLAEHISDADLHVLVLTKGHEQLLSGVVIMWGTGREFQRAVIDSVDLEVNQRIEAFDTAIRDLDAQIRRWSQYSHFVLPDTGFYIKHPQKLEEADFGPLINVWQSPIHVLVPMVVVDELDRLKEIKDRNVRWRAGYTLAVIDRVFAVTAAPGWLRKGEVSTTDSMPSDVLQSFPPEITTAMAAEGIQRSDITMELLFDPPGHVRLPINDDEIVDRAVAVEQLAGRKVTFLTYDTGQSTRARNAGLQVVKLSKDIEEEPTEEEPQSRRAARRRSGGPTQSLRV
jgi:hypothetical protein